MSILVKGMEMPDKHKTIYGYKQDYVDCRIWKDGTVCLLYGAYSNTTPYKAIPVPPHGELIDKNDLDIYYREEQAWSDYEQNRDNEYLEGVKDGLHEAAKQLSIAPIVIEAELPVHHGTFAAWSEEEALKRVIREREHTMEEFMDGVHGDPEDGSL